ncbi:MAG: replication initiation protein, partial [Cyanobacteriota bacterium]
MNERHFVVKSNALIEARYRLSLQESHVILWLLTQIRPDDEDFKTHELNVDEFSRMVGLNVKGQYSELQKIIENLMRRIL